MQRATAVLLLLRLRIYKSLKCEISRVLEEPTHLCDPGLFDLGNLLIHILHFG